MPSSARDEAERLVAAVLAVADTAGLGGFADSVRDAVGRVAGSSPGSSQENKPPAADDSAAADRPPGAGTVVGVGAHKPASGSGHKPGGGWATGSAECCVCPVCQAIAAARNPSPATAVRIATSAGDIATGLAGLMRGLSGLAGVRSKRPASRAPRPAPAPSPDEAWSTATRRADSSGEFPTNPENRSNDPWAAASAAGAAAAEEERAAARREAAEKARAAAAEAAQRVAAAAAAAEAAKARAVARAVAQAGDEIGDTEGGGGRPTRTPRRFDVWAAATAEAGVADVARPTTVDHDGLDHDGPENGGLENGGLENDGLENDGAGDAERDDATGDGTV